MKDLQLRAVLTGAMVDIVGTFILGELFYAVVSMVSGVETSEQLNAVFDASLSLQAASLFLGLVMTLVGAYVAARMVRGHERAHAFAVGVTSTVVGFTIVFAAPESAPFWSEATSLLLTIPAAYLGGELRRLQVGRGPAR